MRTIKALLIEDNPADAALMGEALAAAEGVEVELTTAGRLSLGLTMMCGTDFDVLLLDLSLPDSSGLQTLERAQAREPDLPIVVLTGLADENVAIGAVQRGAQDYLVKNRVDTATLTRTILYSIQRHRILTGVRDAKQEFGTGEFEKLQHGTGAPTASQATHVLGLRHLDRAASDALAGRLSAVLDSIGPQGGTVHRERLSPELRTIASELGKQRAGPQDVLDLCTKAIDLASPQGSAVRGDHASTRDSLALGLLGHLTTYYRDAAAPEPSPHFQRESPAASGATLQFRAE